MATQKELFAALKTLGLPVAYGEFVSTRESPAPAPNFITYQFTGGGDMKADNQNYLGLEKFDIELYTSKKDPVTEKLVQDKLKELRLPYTKVESWIEAEKMRQVIYTIQILGG